MAEVRVKRSLGVLVMMTFILGWAGTFLAQAPKHVKVLLEFRRSGGERREAVQGSGRVVITEKGSARPAGRLGAAGTQARVEQSTGIFTIVPDGGDATLNVATQVPYPQVVFYTNYGTGAGYLAAGVMFKDVGTSLKVSATVLPGNHVRVRLTPRISYFSADGSGTIEFTEASTELVVPNGRPVVLGGATTQTHEVTRRILGFGESQIGSRTTVVLTATLE